MVDDDPKTLRYVRDALAGSEYAPLVTGDPEEVSGLIRTERPRLVLLDLMLPGTDGIELMERVPELADLPVIFISGYGRDETIARALEAGAVDYIVKPLSPMELRARIRAALRRQAEPEPYVLGGLEIHYEERRVSVAGRPVELTATEYELLRVLSRNAGRVSTYEDLLRQVWGGRHHGDTELVRTFVKNLRRKLGDDAASPAYIVNERGVGLSHGPAGQVSVFTTIDRAVIAMFDGLRPSIGATPGGVSRGRRRARPSARQAALRVVRRAALTPQNQTTSMGSRADRR